VQEIFDGWLGLTMPTYAFFIAFFYLNLSRVILSNTCSASSSKPMFTIKIYNNSPREEKKRKGSFF
jgi:hypothetical protein